MEPSFIHADIFFFVTTICVTLLTILAVIAWIYGMKIMSNVRHVTDRAKEISDKAKTESDFIIAEITNTRRRLHKNRFNIVAFYRLVRHLILRYT